MVTEKIFDETFSKVKPSPVQGKDEHVSFTNEDFFSSDFSHNRTAFLVGSSHIQNLDIRKINNLIQSDDLVTVYNFERGGDTPEKRLKELDQIIANKPEIIFYGISYRDFSFPYVNKDVILPDPQFFILDSIYPNFYDIVPSNPQLITKTVLTKIIRNPEEPHFEMSEDNKKRKLATDDELRKSKVENTLWNNVATPYKNIDALHQIIEQLHDHEIKIIIFTTPLHKYYLDSLSDNQKKNFSTLLNDLEKQYGLNIYHFEEKYTELNMWDDISHISPNENVTAFNNDIAEMIMMETRK